MCNLILRKFALENIYYSTLPSDGRTLFTAWANKLYVVGLGKAERYLRNDSNQIILQQGIRRFLIVAEEYDGEKSWDHRRRGSLPREFS
ncbi:MAG: hypothetical protein NPIRA06_05230 [Nitrospirales bacterium]|nr:MAG: hypothetical protein NPIRA06_05230 [Nitrospirales bacterium]